MEFFFLISLGTFNQRKETICIDINKFRKTLYSILFKFDYKFLLTNLTNLTTTFNDFYTMIGIKKLLFSCPQLMD